MASSDLRVIQIPMVFDAAALSASCEQAEIEAQVSHVCKQLDLARDTEDPQALVDVLDCLMAHVSQPTALTITDDQCGRLWRAVNYTCLTVWEFRGGPYIYEKLRLGFDSVMGLIATWGETEQQRAARCPDIVPDLRDYAGIFRNDLHTLVLKRAIQARTDERLDDPVAAFHPVFCEHVA